MKTLQEALKEIAIRLSRESCNWDRKYRETKEKKNSRK